MVNGGGVEALRGFWVQAKFASGRGMLQLYFLGVVGWEGGEVSGGGACNKYNIQFKLHPTNKSGVKSTINLFILLKKLNMKKYVIQHTYKIST